MNRRKITAYLLTCLFVFAFLQVPHTYGADVLIANPTDTAFAFQDEEINLPAYDIEGEIYVPMHSAASLIGGHVVFNSELSAVLLRGGEGEDSAQRTQTMAEFVKMPGRTASPSPHTFYFQGSEVGIDMLIIDDYNFISLTEIAQAYDFEVRVEDDGAIIRLVEDPFYGMDESRFAAYRTYLKENVIPLDTKSLSSIPAGQLDGYTMYFVGENHGILLNYDVYPFFVKYFHQQMGINCILIEAGYADSVNINRYLATGDEALLDRLISGYVGSSNYNKGLYNFYKEIYEYNKTLPEAERIKFVGIDVQHNVNEGMAFLAAYYEGAANLPEVMQKDYEALQNASNRQDFFQFSSDVSEHEEVYKATFGEEDYQDFKFTLRGTTQSLEYYQANSMELRESFIHENVKAVYDEMNIGKCFGMFGGAHVYLDGMFSDTQTNLANYMNNSLEQTKGKVLSITIDYNNCYYMDQETGTPIPVNSSRSAILSDLMAETAPGSLALYPLDKVGSPFIEDEITKTNQYYLIMKDSPATEIYGDIWEESAE